MTNPPVVLKLRPGTQEPSPGTQAPPRGAAPGTQCTRGIEGARLHVALRQLATASGPQGDAAARYRAQCAVICLLYPAAVGAAYRAAGGEVSPDDLTRITSAIVTKAVCANSNGPHSDVAARVMAMIRATFGTPAKNRRPTGTARKRSSSFARTG